MENKFFFWPINHDNKHKNLSLYLQHPVCQIALTFWLEKYLVTFYFCQICEMQRGNKDAMQFEELFFAEAGPKIKIYYFFFLAAPCMSIKLYWHSCQRCGGISFLSTGRWTNLFNTGIRPQSGCPTTCELGSQIVDKFRYQTDWIVVKH